MSTTTRPERSGSFRHRLFLGLAGEVGRVLVLHRLQVLAVEHQLALALEHLVAGADQARAPCSFGRLSRLVRIV